jgi:hypothetical protein
MPSHSSSCLPSRREFLTQIAQAGIIATAARPSALVAQNTPVPPPQPIPQVIGYPGPWQFNLPRGSIILVSDQQLEDLGDPDRKSTSA